LPAVLFEPSNQAQTQGVFASIVPKANHAIECAIVRLVGMRRRVETNYVDRVSAKPQFCREPLESLSWAAIARFQGRNDVKRFQRRPPMIRDPREPP
jgi:hypothetical protein